MSLSLSDSKREKLIRLGKTLIDQDAAKVIVPPQRPGIGHWFGGGNMVQDAEGVLWATGRFRNQGDSRTGLGMGERGLELAIFRSADGGKTFEKSLSFSKADLNSDAGEVLSIEGTALRLTDRGAELYISTEKKGIEYPPAIKSYLKPGTGVWVVERLVADTVSALKSDPLELVLQGDDPQFIQVKDPFIYEHGGSAKLMYCTHPFCWTSSNTGYVAIESDGRIGAEVCDDFFPRGFTWDVAMTRGTAVLPVPKIGDFKDESLALMFYDGGECVRDLDEHASAVKRPRGYSCEELGGLAVVAADDVRQQQRLSVNEPMFVSPNGTGCSRYVDVLATPENFYATWQQSQADGSQPLVMNVIATEEVEKILS